MDGSITSAAPKGVLSAATLLALVGWAAVTGAVIGVTQGIRRRLILALGGTPPGDEAGEGSA